LLEFPKKPIKLIQINTNMNCIYKKKVSTFNFKISSIFILLSVLGFNEAMAQKDLTISGGNTVSSLVCGNRKVYTFGVGAANPPVPVVFPGGVDIQQVNSGSGGTFTAVDCNGNVFAWGNNKFGQVGNGTTGAAPTPTLVKASAGIAATNRDASGNLINTSVVYGGNNTSYAILNDGKLAAWGHNSSTGSGGSYDNNDGMVGNGTTTDALSAVYVLDGTTGLPLKGVTQIFSGDNATYALAGGVVYSWGNGAVVGGVLGRPGSGTMAFPVLYNTDPANPDPLHAPNSIMNDIVSISAGDVFGMALDSKGYVWTWGNGGWNHSTGTGFAGITPHRVLKGTTTGASNDGTYLLAKAIGGGQGYGMAVAIDGKPVAWGGAGCAGGGATGNGTMAGSEPLVGPGYILNGPGAVHSDVVSINRGDLFGWYVRADGSIYGWGCNSGVYAGILGLGNSIDQPYATLVTPPGGCTFRDPQPTVALSPGDQTVCQSKFTSLVLSHGFVISPALAASYEVRWYKNPVGTKTRGTPILTTTAANPSYTATAAPAKYNVEIEYIGTNKGCAKYDIAKDSMTIDVYPVTFSAPTNLTYCDPKKVKVNVTSTATTNPSYDWFPTMGSTTALGSSIGSGSTTIDISTATAGTGTDKIVYAEEKAYATGLTFTKAQAKDPAFSSFDFLNPGAYNDNNQSGFTITEPVNIDSLTINLKNDTYGATTYAATLNFGIYGTKMVNGAAVADQTNVIGTYSYAFSRTSLAADTKTADYTIPVGVKLPKAGTYFFSLISVTGASGNGNLQIGKGASSGQALPVVDNVNGKLFNFTNSSGGFANPQTAPNINQGNYYNIKFKTLQHYCDRIPVIIKQVCPCQKPQSVTITATPAPTAATATAAKTVSVCQGTAITLNGNYVAGTNPLTNTIQYVWYKKNGTTGPAPAAYAAIPIGTKSLTGAPADSGVWILRVEDGNVGSASCYMEDSVRVKVDVPILPGTIAADQNLCGNATTPAVFNRVVNKTVATGGNLKTMTYAWESGSALAGPFTAIGAATDTGYTPPPLSSSTFYRRKATSGTLCPSTFSNVISKIVDVLPLTPATPTGVTPACTTTTISVSPGAPAGVTYFWEPTATSVLTTSNAATAQTITASGTYYVRAQNNAGTCWSPADKIAVIIDAPVIAGRVAADQRACGGPAAPFTPVALTSTTSASGGSTAGPIVYLWQTTTDTTVSTSWTDIPASNTAGYAPPALSATAYFRRKASSGTCPAVYAKLVSIIIDQIPAKPAIPSGTTPSCTTSVLSVSPAAPAGVGYFWEPTATDVLTTLPASATQTVTTSGTYYVRAQNTAAPTCWSAASSLPVVIDALVTPGTVAADQSNCGGTGAAFTPQPFTSATAAGGGSTAGPIVYQWQSSPDNVTWTNIATTNTAGYSAPALTQTTYYRRQASSGTCPAVFTPKVAVTIGTIPADPTAITGVTPACPSSSLTIAAAPAGAAYYWQGTTAVGTSTALPATTPYTVNTSGKYYVRAQNTTSLCWSLNSANIDIVINSLAAGAIAAKEVVCEGKNPQDIISTTPGSGGSGSLTYQWQTSSDTTVAGGWGNVASATALTFPFTAPITATTFYRRTVTSGTCVNNTYAIAKIFSPKPKLAPPITGPSPLCEGDPGVYVLTGPETGVKYNWSRPPGTSLTSANSIDSTTITVKIGSTSGNFVVTPYNSCGTGPTSTLPVQVKPILTPGVSIAGSDTICINSNAMFYIKAANDSGSAPTYAWKLTLKSTGATSVVSTTKSFSSTTLQDGDKIQLEMTSNEKCKSAPSVLSNQLTIVVVGQVQPQVSLTPTSVCSGVSQTITANPSNGGTPSYDWTINGVLKQSGLGNTYSAIFTDGDSVAVRMTSTSGCAFPSKFAKKGIKLVVKPIPQATVNNPEICSGSQADITLSSTVAGTIYAWSATADPQVTGMTLTGTTNTGVTTISQTLSLAAGVTGPKVLPYSITPTANSCTGPAVTSKITVNPIPDVIATPSPICNGATTSIALSSTVTGATFTWTATGSSSNVSGFQDDNTATKTNIAQVLNNTGSATENVTYKITSYFSNGAVKCTSNPKPIINSVYPTPVFAAVTQSDICSGQATNIPLASNVTGTTYSWTSTGTGITGSAGSGTTGPIQETLTNSSSTMNAPMSYAIDLTANGCPGLQVKVPFNVKPIPVGTASPQAPICGGNPVNITLSPSTATFTWTITTNGTVTAPSPSTSGGTITQTLVNPGPNANTAVFHIIPTLNLCPGQQFDATVNVNPAPVANPVTPGPICSGASSSITLTSATPGTTFKWTTTFSGSTISTTGLTAGATASIAQPYLNSGSADGTATFNVIPNANGCDGGPISIDLTVKPIPVVTTVNSNPKICSGQSTAIALNSTTAGTTFDVTASGGMGSSNVTGVAIGYNIAQALTGTAQTDVTYITTPTANGCPGAPYTDKVTLYPIPVSNAGKPLPLCSGDSSRLLGGPISLDYKYSWTPKAGLSSDTVSNPVAFPLSSTTYSVTTTLRAFTCSSSDVATVKVFPKIKVDAGPDVLICSKESTMLSASPGGLLSYLWSNGASGQTITVAPEKTIKYIVRASNGGCFATDTVIVNIKNVITPTLYIPNSFSPNADGTNDVFQAQGESVIDFEGAIMTRWGEKIYTWTDINQGWDGYLETPQGKKVQEDVYVYTIRVKNLCESQFSPAKTGTITIVK
jgi:gliding motility-associated-like protein